MSLQLFLAVYVVFAVCFKFYHLQSLDFNHDTSRSEWLKMMKMNDYLLLAVLVYMGTKCPSGPMRLLVGLVIVHQLHSMWYLQDPTARQGHVDIVRAGFVTALVCLESIWFLWNMNMCGIRMPDVHKYAPTYKDYGF